jgi:peptide/nickel transport system permease protein
MQRPGRPVLVWRYVRRNQSLLIGLLIVLGLSLFTGTGLAVVNPDHAYPLAVKSQQPPSLEFPLGTDFFGRDLLTALVVGLWQTALIGVLAGSLGVSVGIVLGFTSAYFGGYLDAAITAVCQILTPIPALLVQILIAGSLTQRNVTIYTMAIVVALLAWMGPTLMIRAQVLTMKERRFVLVAKLSGMGDLAIIFREILPNLLPFVAAAFVGQVFGAVFASLYLAVLGLGPLREPLMGNLIWAAQGQSAFFNGWWWWPTFPALAMVLILGALALISLGLDELANPRVRRSE